MAQHAFDKVVTYQRVQAAERLIEHQQLWFEGQGGNKRDLDTHTMRKGANFTVDRQLESTQHGLFERVVPIRVERSQVIEIGAHGHFPRKHLALRDVADLAKVVACEFT